MGGGACTIVISFSKGLKVILGFVQADNFFTVTN